MIGDKIKEIRTFNNMTQQSLADKVGISFQALSNYENNRRTPNIELIKKICKALGCTTDELLEFDTKEERNKVVINNYFNNSQNINMKK